jgi:hypothetical protein
VSEQESEQEWAGVPESAQAWRWTDEERLRGHEPWGPGPWDHEPDKVSWTDPTSGRPCLIVRGPMGALCGYVAFDPGHPLHGMHYDTTVDVSAPEGALETLERAHDAAHGGLTFADACAHSDDEARGICHIPQPGQPGDVWWFGFDAGHSFDLIPALEASHRRFGFAPIPGMNDIYRTIGYMAARCRELAAVLGG